MLGTLCNARVVLGSATPSLESWQLAVEDRIAYLPMPERVEGRPMPEVDIVDMTSKANKLDIGPSDGEDTRHDAPTRKPRPGDDEDEVAREIMVRRLISRPLFEALGETLERGEQAILLLNRRGHATFIQCLSCGHALYCPNCSVSLTFHRRTASLRCHLCEHRQKLPEACPQCTQRDLGLLGVGTERLTNLVSELFPEHTIGRLDRDTGGGRRLRALLGRFRRHEIDVLVGTQMVAKGHDVHNVTLVGVIMADLGLNFPDFRSAERTFQLMTQVAGRAGRGERPGRVLIQSLSPAHSALQAARLHDYEHFATHEIPLRRQLRYPPFGFLIAVRFEAKRPALAEQAAEMCARALNPHLGPQVQALGPALAPLGRIRGRTRYQILLKGTERGPVRRALGGAMQAIEAPLQQRFRNVRVVVDVDPQDLL